MAKIYKSKLGLELVIPIALILGTVLFLTVSGETSWLGVLILSLLILFIIHVFLTTYYTIDGNFLFIKCGFLYNSKIDIHTIRKIAETNNPMSAPATSLDQMDFIAALKSINPTIEIQLKKANGYWRIPTRSTPAGVPNKKVKIYRHKTPFHSVSGACNLQFA